MPAPSRGAARWFGLPEREHDPKAKGIRTHTPTNTLPTLEICSTRGDRKRRMFVPEVLRLFGIHSSIDQ